jgi:nitroreductase
MPNEPNDVGADFVRGIRVTRNYLDRPLTDEHMDALIEVARWTGSSKNNQGWSLIVIDDRDQIELLASAGSFTGPFKTAVAVLVPVRSPEGNDFDIGRMAQSIIVTAELLGIGACPITLHKTERANEVLGLTDGNVATWCVSLGYPDIEAEEQSRDERRRSNFIPSGRKSVDEFVKHQRWS